MFNMLLMLRQRFLVHVVNLSNEFYRFKIKNSRQSSSKSAFNIKISKYQIKDNTMRTT